MNTLTSSAEIYLWKQYTQRYEILQEFGMCIVGRTGSEMLVTFATWLEDCTSIPHKMAFYLANLCTHPNLCGLQFAKIKITEMKKRQMKLFYFLRKMEQFVCLL